ARAGPVRVTAARAEAVEEAVPQLPAAPLVAAAHSQRGARPAVRLELAASEAAPPEVRREAALESAVRQGVRREVPRERAREALTEAHREEGPVREAGRPVREAAPERRARTVRPVARCNRT